MVNEIKVYPCIHCPKGQKLIDSHTEESKDEFMRCTCPALKNYEAWLEVHCKGYDDL